MISVFLLSYCTNLRHFYRITAHQTSH